LHNLQAKAEGKNPEVFFTGYFTKSKVLMPKCGISISKRKIPILKTTEHPGDATAKAIIRLMVTDLELRGRGNKEEEKDLNYF
jgi:hypothetical protein